MMFVKIGILLLFPFVCLFFQDETLLKSIERGQKVYEQACIKCHKQNGEGVAKFFPPLTNSDYLRDQRVQSIRAVKFGQRGKITVNGITYNSQMLPPGLKDEEVTDVMNYILHSWGNKTEKPVTLEDVQGVNRIEVGN